jgi:hypothetical protein
MRAKLKADLSLYALSILIVSFLSFVLHKFRTPGVTPDSVAHISVADNLILNKDLVDFTGETLSLFPPLYAILLAAFQENIGFDFAVVSINTIALSGIAVITLRLADLLRFNLGQKVFSVASVFCSGTFLIVTTNVWVEAAFTFFVIYYFYVEYKSFVLGTTHSLRHNSYLSLVFLCAFELRYAALFLIGYTFISRILFVNPKSAIEISRSLGYVGLLLLVPVLHMILNFKNSGGPFGERKASSDKPLEVFNNLASGIGSLFNSIDASTLVLKATGLLVIALVAITLYFKAKMNAWSDSLFQTPLLLAVYFGYMSVAQLVSAFDAIDSRIMAPVYPILIIFLVSLSAVYVKSIQARFIVIAYLSYSLIGVLLYLNQDNESGFSNSSWSERQWVAVQSIPEKSQIISDSPEAVYFYTKTQPIDFAPQKSFYRSSESSESLDAQLRFESNVLYYVWLGGGLGDFYSPYDLISKGFSTKLVFDSEGIQIFAVSEEQSYLNE